ncbi:hypothetical protein KUV57_13230 [Epibacterium sp. DP7N7-1]|nr:hypothetical protein [Epibacterium sp. DP7N7-1]
MNKQNFGLPATSEIAKAQAKRLRTAIEPQLTLNHGQSLELIARVHGEPSWGRLNSLIANSTPVNPAPAQPVPAASGPLSDHKPKPGTEIEQRAIQALLEGLEKDRDTRPTAKTSALATKLLKDELIPTISLEAWLDTLDAALGGMVFDMGTDLVLELSGVEEIHRFKRPKASETQVYAQSCLRPEGFAAVLIWLERLGFDTHPEVFYDAFLPKIKKAKFLEKDELTCFWHAKERRHFKTDVCFRSNLVLSDAEQVSFTGRTGLNVRATRSKDGLRLVESLRVFR